MGRLFGTDGVRGIANKELTPELAFNLGKAGTYVLKKGQGKPTIIIGSDTRVSSDLLENALTAGILAVGGNVMKVGVIPTPAVAFLTQYYKADAGIVISASHNTFEYNGIKFFNSKGFKLDDSIEEKIEDIIISSIDVNSHITGENIGKAIDATDSWQVYAKHLVDSVNLDLKGKKIVIDCANGAAYKVAEKVYTDLGATVHVIGNKPNGVNINDGYGSTHPENLAKEVKRQGAFLGLSFDGDADRLIACDEKGNIVDGDVTIAILAKDLKKRNELSENKVTVTVMSNIGFHKEMKSNDIDVEVTNVGDRYVLESMLKTGSVLGGEQSGHIIFLKDTTTGDGVLSSLNLVRAVMNSDKTLSELTEEIKIYPQVLVNARINKENKKTYMENEEVSFAIEQVNKKLEGKGRLLIRPSGTEPLVRVMIEGDDISEITEMAESLVKLLENKFPVEE